jgi:hypothetical protein
LGWITSKVPSPRKLSFQKLHFYPMASLAVMRFCAEGSELVAERYRPSFRLVLSQFIIKCVDKVWVMGPYVFPADGQPNLSFLVL